MGYADKGREGADHEAPVDTLEKLALEEVELVEGYAADAGVGAVGVEGVAEALAGDGDGRDDEAVAGEGGEGEERCAGADPVDVVQDQEEAGFLWVGGWVCEPERKRNGRERKGTDFDVGESDDASEII